MPIVPAITATTTAAIKIHGATAQHVGVADQREELQLAAELIDEERP